MSITITPATEADIDLLIWLNGIAQKLHARIDPTLYRREPDKAGLRKFWAERLKEADSYVAVARSGDTAVGYIWFQKREQAPDVFFQSRRFICGQHICVAPDARRGGVAKALMSYMHDQARALGIDKIILDTWAENEAVQSLVKSEGYAPINVVWAKDLPGG